MARNQPNISDGRELIRVLERVREIQALLREGNGSAELLQEMISLLDSAAGLAKILGVDEDDPELGWTVLQRTLHS